ncbi:tetratricopeptide repeat protein [Paraburkholderia rhizosphaerae]|uniref:Tetratricopeptide repeat protein n=1 Tax=Paraburkholderia rhizosphaerae TaxID=480658 RepID=A0A4V3HFT7_9BURK|nr:tetratricopeptide repeat-containing glycosyltransferase family protein [Paraburkholderia rhizosphaerae]TDY54937.1 tetratricopeptide repeat protein [Paraburkholderia rhizosphaerae]
MSTRLYRTVFRAPARIRQPSESQLDEAIAQNDTGNDLRRAGQLHEAEQHYRNALRHWPDCPEFHANLADTLEALGRLDEAEAAYRNAIRFNPELHEARFNLSLLLLSQGRYIDAWPLYEARGPLFQEHGTLPFPKWAGEALSGKSLLLLPEQGYGDTIQFVRYAALLKALGVAQLTVACKPELGPLLRTVEGIDTVVTDPNELRMHDYWESLTSLPRHFGTTPQSIPARIPYVGVYTQRMDRWKARLPDSPLRVGLVWKGNPGHENDAARSLPHFATLAPLLSVDGVSFVSLQTGDAELEVAASGNHQHVVCLGKDIHDFADTAAIVAQLNLVIAVDTAIVHLTGALGVACWLMLPKSGVDWRWHRAGAQSSWYPQDMYVFRQMSGGWPEQIASIRSALDEIAHARRQG